MCLWKIHSNYLIKFQYYYQANMLAKFAIKKGTKTFVFDNEVTYKSTSMEFTLDDTMAFVDLSEILASFKQEIKAQNKLIYQIYDPELNSYVKLNENMIVENRFVFTCVIMLKYKQQIPQSDSDSQNPSSISSGSRKQRNKERTIREVVQCVKRWRDIHNTVDNNKNKITLQEAAKMVGISKKSLDDYYSQLRYGEQFQFDFPNHMDQKIGVLRTFVKKHRPKVIRNEKIPKKLKIIEEMFQNVNPSTHRIEQQQQQQHIYIEENDIGLQQMKEQQIKNRNMFELDFNPIQKEQNQYENDFIESFDFMVNEPADPFIPYNPRDYRNFKKKEKEFQDMMFF